MTDLIIPDMDAAVLERLKRLAAAHGRTTEAEAKELLIHAMQTTQVDPWSGVDAIRSRLESTGRNFSDSSELVREDRDR